MVRWSKLSEREQADLISAELKKTPSLTTKDLTSRLSLRMTGVTREGVEHRLRQFPGRFELDTEPRWVCRSAPPSSLTRAASHLREPRRWQLEALAAWHASNYRGVVEAVTGTGKTHVGLMAIEECLKQEGRAVVVVPSKALEYQWRTQLRQLLPASEIGDWSARKRARVTVTTVQAACTQPVPADGVTLLVADECHRYGSEKWRQVLHPKYVRRLGLTATYERSDEGVAEALDPFFRGSCYQIDYHRAITDGIVSRFEIFVVRTQFTTPEAGRYNEADQICRSMRRKLINDFALPEQPFGEFMAQVAKLAQQGIATEAGRVANRYLRAFSDRRQALAGASRKQMVIAELAPLVADSSGTIVFCETKESAEEIANKLPRSRAVHSEISPEIRQTILRSFASGHVKVVVAPRVLDEGVDLPDAELAIVTAASSSKRQMIQRMGRVLRLREGKLARLILVVVAGTPEDPATGGHEAFLEVATDAADRVRWFSSPGDTDALITALREPPLVNPPERPGVLHTSSQAAPAHSTPGVTPLRPAATSPAPFKCPGCHQIVGKKRARVDPQSGQRVHINCEKRTQPVSIPSPLAPSLRKPPVPKSTPINQYRTKTVLDREVAQVPSLRTPVTNRRRCDFCGAHSPVTSFACTRCHRPLPPTG